MLLFTDSLLNFNLFQGFTHTHTRTTLHSTVTVHCRNDFSNLSVSVSNTNHNQDETLSSIINSSGLSSEKLLKLQKCLKVRRSDDGPYAVIQLFRTYGFSASQLSTLVKKHPLVLLSNPDDNLLPKIEFFLSIGVSITDLPKTLIGNISFLSTSLEKNIIPKYHIIRSIVRDDKKAVSVLKRWSYISCSDSIVPNIEVLRNLGVPQSFISLLVSSFPMATLTKHSRFVEAINLVKEMGFHPLKCNFVLALAIFARMDNETWELKLKIFERWGWSKDICLLAFHKYPPYMATSEKKIQKMMSFLTNDMGFTPEDIARCPMVLARNLEKIIVPRFRVIKILKSRGLLKRSLRIGSYLTSEKLFLEKYVTPFQKDLPLVLDAYKGQNSD